MKTDALLRDDVIQALLWDPSVTSADINVATDGGVVTLSGTVPHFAEKHAAERAVQRVGGVKAIAEEMAVHPVGCHQRSDSDIAQSVVGSLGWHVWVPRHIQATVENGYVTLTGIVTWEFERQAADDSVRFISGVKGVSNNITLKPSASPGGIKDLVEKALSRNAELDSGKIRVSADGGRVTLAGSVQTWDERNEARNSAWSAPGVTAVENNLAVSV